MSRLIGSLVITIFAAGLASACDRSGGRSDDPRVSPPEAASAESVADEARAAPATGVVVPDEELVDQDGAPVRLRSLMKDRIVAVNFVFTTCTTICSPMTAVFARLQRELGPSLERDVRLVTISLDPATDTPERLRRYADKFGRRPGWTFLTGSNDRVARVLDALRGEAGAKEGHSPITLVGTMNEGRWTRVYGLAPPARLHREIMAFLPTVSARGSARAP